MIKRIATLVSIALFALPTFAAAATNDQLIALYQQLISVLQQELLALQNSEHAWLSMTPTSGTVPLVVMFTVNHPSQTEAIDYGDGHSSGSNGCTKNALGWCDLSQPVYHSYQLPGTYKVTLYSHEGTRTLILSTNIVTVTAPKY